MDATRDEVWKSIPGYEGKYEASTQGRVRSVDREVHVPAWGRSRFHKGRVLAYGRVGKYQQYHLYDEQGQRAYLAHDLVMRTFVGPRPTGADVCHNDGDPDNNALQNLRYDTRAGNAADKLRHGTNLCGEQVATSKLAPADVRAIRARMARGEMQKDIATSYGVSPTTVMKIKQRKTWGWLD